MLYVWKTKQNTTTMRVWKNSSLWILLSAWLELIPQITLQETYKDCRNYEMLLLRKSWELFLCWNCKEYSGKFTIKNITKTGNSESLQEPFSTCWLFSLVADRSAHQKLFLCFTWQKKSKVVSFEFRFMSHQLWMSVNCRLNDTTRCDSTSLKLLSNKIRNLWDVL